jgi:hypothetical protein
MSVEATNYSDSYCGQSAIQYGFSGLAGICYASVDYNYIMTSNYFNIFGELDLACDGSSTQIPYSQCYSVGTRYMYVFSTTIQVTDGTSIPGLNTQCQPTDSSSSNQSSSTGNSSNPSPSVGHNNTITSNENKIDVNYSIIGLIIFISHITSELFF